MTRDEVGAETLHPATERCCTGRQKSYEPRVLEWMVLHSMSHDREVVRKEERTAGQDWPLRLLRAAHTWEAEAFRWYCKLDDRQHSR